MKKVIAAVFFTFLISFCYGIQMNESVTVEINKRLKPLPGFTIQIVLDVDAHWSGDNLIDFITDQSGRVVIPIEAEYTEKTGIRITSFDIEMSNSAIYYIHNYPGQVLKFNLVENIDYFLHNQSLKWKSVDGAVSYKVEGFKYTDEFPWVIKAGYIQLMDDDEIINTRYTSIENSLDTENPLFEFKGDFTEFSIPVDMSEITKTGIRISAFDSQGLLIAQTPVFPGEADSFLKDDQIHIAFSYWSKEARDFDFEIISRDADGGFITLEKVNTGDGNSLKLDKDDEWPEDLWVRFNVFAMNNGVRKTKRLNLQEHWGKYVRFNLQSEVILEFSDDMISWKPTSFSSKYIVSFYRYKKAERKNVSPNYVQYDVVEDLTSEFDSKIETTYSSIVQFDSPVLEITVDDGESLLWPDELPGLNHYGVVVRGYDADDNEVAVSKLRVWPLQSPALEWDPGHYDRDASALALSGIMMKMHKTNYDSLPIYPLSHSKFESIRDISLGRDWGIYSRDELLESLEKLKEKGHSSSLQSVLNAVNNYPGLSLWEAAMKEQLYFSQVKRMITVKRLSEYFDTRLLHAWDWGRAIYLIRWSYTQGYVSEEESWSLIHSFQELIQKEYSSWDDFGQAYVLGRYYWSSGRGDEINNSREAYDAYLELKTDADSPWTGLWIEDDPFIEKGVFNFEQIINLSDEEEMFNWVFDASDALNEYPHEYKTYVDKAPERWDEYPQNIEIFLLAAERNKDFDIARTYTERALEKYPGYYPFLQILSRLEENANGYSEALDVFNKMEMWAIDLPDNQYLRGRLLYLLEEPEEALELFTEPVKDEYFDKWYYINAHYLSGIILLNQGKEHSALSHLETVYSRAPDNPYYQYYYGISLLLTETERAFEIEQILRKAEGAGAFSFPEWVWPRLSELKKKEAKQMNL